MCTACLPSALSEVCGVRLPDPKFGIGQKVRVSHFCDDDLDPKHYGLWFRVDAVVTGLFWAECDRCWSYYLFLFRSSYWFGNRGFSGSPFLEVELEGI